VVRYNLEAFQQETGCGDAGEFYGCWAQKWRSLGRELYDDGFLARVKELKNKRDVSGDELMAGIWLYTACCIGENAAALQAMRQMLQTAEPRHQQIRTCLLRVEQHLFEGQVRTGPGKGAGNYGDQDGAGNDEKVNKKGHRGRKPDPDIDPEQDKRICRDWEAAKRQGASRKTFAEARGITVKDLIDAQHREKYRRTRDAE
jgi:hypothetical protein